MNNARLYCSLLIGNWQTMSNPDADGLWHPRYQVEGALTKDLRTAHDAGVRHFLCRHPRGLRTHESIRGKGIGCPSPLNLEPHPELVEFMEWAQEPYGGMLKCRSCGSVTAGFEPPTFIAYEGSANLYAETDWTPRYAKHDPGVWKSFWHHLARQTARDGFDALAIDSFPKAGKSAEGGIENGCDILARTVERAAPWLDYYAEPWHNSVGKAFGQWGFIQYCDQSADDRSLASLLHSKDRLLERTLPPILILGAGDDPKVEGDFIEFEDDEIRKVEQRCIRHGVSPASPVWLRGWK